MKQLASSARIQILPGLFILIGMFGLMVPGCNKANTGQPTPWQQAGLSLNAVATVNDGVLRTMIEVHDVKLVSDGVFSKVILEQAHAADVIHQINAIVKQGFPATQAQASQVSALIQQIKSSVEAMLAAGDLHVKNPQTQQDVALLVQGVANAADVLYQSLVAAGVSFGGGATLMPVSLEEPQLLMADVVPIPTPGSSIPQLILMLISFALSTGPLVLADIIKIRALFQQTGLTPQQLADKILSVEIDTDTITDEDIALANVELGKLGLPPYQKV